VTERDEREPVEPAVSETAPTPPPVAPDAAASAGGSAASPESAAEAGATPASAPSPDVAEGGVVPREIVVTIAGRHPGEPLQLVVEDEETAERLRQLANGALRREELNRQLETVRRDREELDALAQHLELDPAGFLVTQIKPEILVEVARHLLSLPEVLAALGPELVGWLDDSALLTRRRAELAQDRATYRQVMDRALATLAAARGVTTPRREPRETAQPADTPHAQQPPRRVRVRRVS
jgi:hypothetical protein